MPKRRKTKALTVPKFLPAKPATNGDGLVLEAVRHGMNAEQIRELRVEYEAIRAFEARMQFDRAWAAAQAALPLVIRSKKVDFPTAKGGRMSYRYAPFSEIVATVKPILGKFGLAYNQTISNTPTHVSVKTILMGFGHREEPGSALTLPLDDSGQKNPIQQGGSAQSYAQRYTLLGALGLATADDDDARATTKTAAKITTEQAKEINTALQGVTPRDGDFIARMLTLLSDRSPEPIKTVADIPAEQFDNVLHWIATRKKQLDDANAPAS